MDDEAYHSGNLQSSSDLAEKASPSLLDTGSTSTGALPAEGKVRDRGESIKVAGERAGSKKNENSVARNQQAMPIPYRRLDPSSPPGSSESQSNRSVGQHTAGVAGGELPSPSTRYDSGIFPSLPDTERGSEGREQDGSKVRGDEKVDAPQEGMETESEGSSLSPSSSRDNSPLSGEEAGRSPIVPPVGVSVEVVTENAMEREMGRPSGTSTKRVMATTPPQDLASAKSPRLTGLKLTSLPAPQPSSQRPIRVPTIVSPGESLLLTSLMKVRRGGLDRLREKAQEKMEVQRPAAVDGSAQECTVVRTERGFPPSPNARPSRVNYDSVQELAQSDVRCGEDEEKDSGAGVRSPLSQHTYSRPGESSAFTERRSPKPVPSPVTIATSPMSVENLISRVPKPRGASPSRAAYRSSVSPQDLRRTVVDSERDPSEGYHSAELEGVASEEDKKEEKKPQSALLQVSEAHLAILPDEDGDTPLHLAVIHENLSLTQYLVQLIVGVYMNLDIANNMRQTPLHLAVITRQPNMVRLMVGAGASVNFPDRKGNTSIHLAAQRKDLRILQLLSQATSPLPDFNTRNFAGLTAVHVATREAAIDVLKYLFQMGANKNTPDSCSGRTPLHYAVESENFILVNYLLENGCNVNAATFSGNTPLHIAAGRRLKEIVALLMAYGANPAIANGEGDFPTDLPASLLMQRARMNAH